MASRDTGSEDDLKRLLHEILEQSRQAQPLEYIFGLRKPGSKRLTHNDAFVVAKPLGGNITSAIFENDADFIRHPRTYREAMETYDDFLSAGWLPMDREDLETVSGTAKDIVESTRLSPPTDSKKQRCVHGALFAISLFLLFCFSCSFIS